MAAVSNTQTSFRHLPPKNPPKTYPNPIKTALQYNERLESGQEKTQSELASALGVSRAKVTQMLNLLKLDEEIKEYIASLDNSDSRLRILTERRLRKLVQVESKEEQWELFRDWLE